MSASDIPALIAAIAFAIMVLFLAIPLWRLGGVFGELRNSIKEVTAESMVAVKGAADAVTEANSQLQKVDTITSAAARSAEDLSAMTTLVSATVGRPLVKIAALSYATRRVLHLGQKEAPHAGR